MKKIVSVILFSAFFAFALVPFAVAASAAEDQTGGPAPTPQFSERGKGGFHGPEFGPHDGRGRLEQMINRLGISPDQKKQIRALYTNFRDKTRKLRTDLLSFKDEKKTMMLSGKVDQQKLAQIDDQIWKAKSELLKERLKLGRDRLALLTPDQIEKISEMKMERAFNHKMRGMGGRHGGHRGGHGGFGASELRDF